MQPMIDGTDDSSTLPWWQRVFALDFRSLAALRIALGALLVWDVVARWNSAEAFCSDGGYFSRELWRQWYDATAAPAGRHLIWSVHALHGSLEWAQTLLVCQALLAILFFFGFQTRLTTIGLWVLVASLHVRCPLITSSGDTLLKLMLFWGMFLPLGKVWSLDARRVPQTASGSTHLSVASAAMVVQIALMYFFTGLAKWNSVWIGGTAMHYVLRQEIYATELGQALLSQNWLLKLVSWATLAVEIAGIWLLFLPWRNGLWRMGLLVVFWSFHLGIALTLSIGLFPWICMAAWLVLVPGSVWDSIGAGLRAPNPQPVAGQPPAWTVRFVRTVIQVFCALNLLVVLMWNIVNLDPPALAKYVPRPIQWLGRIASLEQHFQMFGVPYRESPWFVYRASLMDGSEVDLVRRDRQVSMEKPLPVRNSLPGFHWRVLHRNLMAEPLARFRLPMLEYFVRKWDREHTQAERVAVAELTVVSEPTGPDYNGVDRMTVIWNTWKAADLPADWQFRQMMKRRERSGLRGF